MSVLGSYLYFYRRLALYKSLVVSIHPPLPPSLFFFPLNYVMGGGPGTPASKIQPQGSQFDYVTA